MHDNIPSQACKEWIVFLIPTTPQKEVMSHDHRFSAVIIEESKMHDILSSYGGKEWSGFLITKNMAKERPTFSGYVISHQETYGDIFKH